MYEKKLKCVMCDHILTIQRKKSKNRPVGHIKHLWCPMCEKRLPHEELDEFETSFQNNWLTFSAVK